MSGKSFAPLGTVLHIIGKEAIVKLKSKKIPKKEMNVYNEKMEKIGITTNPFGPVKSPYVGVILSSPGKAPSPGSVLLLEIKREVKGFGLKNKSHFGSRSYKNKPKKKISKKKK